VTGRLPHNLRSDARDNRELILATARAVFAAEGLNVPMREIARRAGVGTATLYRRFPTATPGCGLGSDGEGDFGPLLAFGVGLA
jgi:hypothetical protein